ncbi:AAA family ATPase [Sphingorhabdus sp.]|uniref:ATP-binding protein n=1 Tax=Sphingorhabdus sp. TaxID=1902408 RepID=UPI0033407BB9
MTKTNTCAVLLGHGINDTRKRTNTPYDTIGVDEIFERVTNPTAISKDAADFIIPSTYTTAGGAEDARSHHVQRAHGRFPLLMVDIDKGNHDMSDLTQAVSSFVGDVRCAIYSTASAKPDDRKWRMAIPFDRELDFNEWSEAGEAFFDHLKTRGIVADPKLLGPGQPVYLPNVPPEGRKDDGSPIFYEHVINDGPAADLNAPEVSRVIAALRRRRTKEQELRLAAAKKAADRRNTRQNTGTPRVIEEFNISHDIEALLFEYGYEQSPRNDKDWRSPNQMTESFATRVMQADAGSQVIVSLSGSDDDAEIGAKAASGCRFGDAFDLYVHYEHGGDFNAALKQVEAEAAVKAAFEQANKIKATPYDWRDPTTIPRRQWVFERWLLNGTVAVVVAPGGMGKSTLISGMALSLASGRKCLGKTVWGGPKRVWVWNQEDDLNELSRSLQAAAKLHGLEPVDISDNLFVDSAMDGAPLCTATEDRNGVQLLEPVYEAIKEELLRRGINVLIIDPFVSSHEVDENSNTKIDKIVKAWGRVAKAADCVIVLVHHTSKAGSAEVNTNSARGASALASAARSLLTLNRMTLDDAKKYGIEEDQRWRYIVVSDDKHNRAPAENGTWFHLNSVELGNGSFEHPSDNVAALEPWSPPTTQMRQPTTWEIYEIQRLVDAKAYREDIQAKEWVGHAIAKVLQLDLNNATDKRRVKDVQRDLIISDFLLVEERKHVSKLVKFVVTGTRVVLDEDCGLDLI